MQFFISACDNFEPETNPNGKARIFGIGTKVRTPTGQIGTVAKIGRSKLSVKLASLQGQPIRSFEARYLEII